MKRELLEYVEAMDASDMEPSTDAEMAAECAYVYCQPIEIFRVWIRSLKFKYL